jgi:hypothetical protein
MSDHHGERKAMTSREAAAALDVTLDTLYKMAATGELPGSVRTETTPPHRQGWVWSHDPEAVEQLRRLRQPATPDEVTSKEAAVLIGVHTTRISHLRLAGELAGRRTIGNKYVFSRKSVEAYAAARTARFAARASTEKAVQRVRKSVAAFARRYGTEAAIAATESVLAEVREGEGDV